MSKRAARRAARRLIIRIEEMPRKQGDFLRYHYHKPGSQNVKK
jgi:hypothetical protein